MQWGKIITYNVPSTCPSRGAFTYRTTCDICSDEEYQMMMVYTTIFEVALCRQCQHIQQKKQKVHVQLRTTVQRMIPLSSTSDCDDYSNSDDSYDTVHESD